MHQPSQKKLYIDTSIWRDLHENRSDNMRPLGDWAFDLIRNARERKEKVLTSNLVIEELSIAYDEKTIKTFFQAASEVLKHVDITEQQSREARLISRQRNVPFGDALHAIIARDNNAIMVTRDHHFELLKDIVTSKKPEELL